MCFHDVNKNAGHVEKAGKPGNNKNDVDSLEIKKGHGVKMVRTQSFVNSWN